MDFSKGLFRRMKDNTIKSIRFGHSNIFENISFLKTGIMELVQWVFAVAYMQKPIETASRGVLGKASGFVLKEYLVRNPVHGLTQILNMVMVPKKKLDPGFARMPLRKKLSCVFSRPKELGRYFINKLRPDANYLKVIKQCGANLSELFETPNLQTANLDKAIKTHAYWTRLDLNAKKLLELDIEKSRQLLSKLPKTTRVAKELAKRMTHTSDVLSRIMVLNYLSSMLYMLAFGLFTGIAVLIIVFKYFAPYDRYLESSGWFGHKRTSGISSSGYPLPQKRGKTKPENVSPATQPSKQVQPVVVPRPVAWPQAVGKPPYPSAVYPMMPMRQPMPLPVTGAPFGPLPTAWGPLNRSTFSSSLPPLQQGGDGLEHRRMAGQPAMRRSVYEQQVPSAWGGSLR
ncbi:MAG: hypothetical protein KC474_06910 [Cyanobacteria bacterium HKST-UBA04]|nr:hypothetical protein [Cyanobacteria bacterium HKST-UBA04]